MQFRPVFASCIIRASSDKTNHLALAIFRACLAETRQALPLQIYAEFLFSLLNDFEIVFYNLSKLV